MIEESQRNFWEFQHQKRKNEHEILENKPNIFAKECLKYIPQNGMVLEIGSANGRDARYFAREKRVKVIALDFSKEALDQLKKASEKDGSLELVFPALSDANNLPIKNSVCFDAVYSRSALNLSDEELNNFFEQVVKILKPEGYLMIEGKTRDDFKILKSKEIYPNLFIDDSGHLRRAWREQCVSLFDKYELRLISSKKTEEIWRGNKTNFINFIAQKI